ncbi:MAG: TonB-dependent receptor [Gemmatimonadaceae bacterium]
MPLAALAALTLAAAGAAPLGAQQQSAAPAAPAGAGTVEGRVVSADRGRPLADVMVRVEGTTRGAVTDADGRFVVSGVPAGPHAVVAQRLGLAVGRQQVTVGAGATRADFSLAEAATVLAPVVVSATREAQRRSEASATIDVLDGAEVRRTRAAHPAQLMNRLPGVHVSELSGEGHSMAIRQPITTKPMYLYLEDGVPTRATGFFNHNALYEVNIPQSGGIEVLKGPGTALYGSDAIGGVVNVLTRPAPATPSVEATLEGGADRYGRLLATGGFTHGATGLRADLNLTRGDGWRDDAGFSRQSGTVRWDQFWGQGWSARTVATGSHIDQQDLPAVNAAQLAARSPINRAPIAFREVRALRVSSAIERERGAALWSFTPYARYDDLGLLPNWQLTFDPQLWDTRNSSLGFLAKYRRDFAPMRARVIVGADADVSPGRFTADSIAAPRTGPDLVWGSYRTAGRQYDYDVTYRAISPYVHTELSPLPRVRVDLGARYDAAGYSYDTRLAPLDTGRHRRPADMDVSYRRLSPKAGVTIDAGHGVNVYGSYRQGFRAPSQSQLFQQGPAAHTVDLEPVRVESYEVGTRGEVGKRLAYQLAAYDMRIRDDIVTFTTPDNERVATNAGQTRHRGVEASLGAALLPRLRLDASWSVASHRYVEWNPSPAVSFAGKDVPQAPRDLGSVLLTWSPRALGGGRLAAEWTHTGRYAMDDRNAQTYGGHEVATLHASYVLLSGRAELFGRAVNLFDRNYAELATYNQFERVAADRFQYNPGAPRTVYAGVKYGL